MKADELKQALIENSPFKFIGESEDIYSFKEDFVFVNGSPYQKVQYVDTKNGIRINSVAGIFPFHENIIIEIPNEDGFSVIVNYDEQKLKEDRYRHKDARDGFFVLQSVKT